jgi:hypothetical protein
MMQLPATWGVTNPLRAVVTQRVGRGHDEDGVRGIVARRCLRYRAAGVRRTRAGSRHFVLQ